MATRASVRTTSARNQASSPRRQSTQSPVARRMRTRSASVEPADNEAAAIKKGKRGMRHASVESAGSNTSATSSNQGGRRKKATRGAITYPELSLVAEDEENEQAEDEKEDEGQPEGLGHPPRSPGGMSQMSGTTAITSASAQTSHTTAELADLDATMVVEVLPDLWVSALKLLALLAPSTASEESVKATVRELKVPGSVQAKRLMHREMKFKYDRDNFGSDNYIRPSFILQKVFGTQEVDDGTARPDAILHAANLATLVKDVFVIEPESQAAWNLLSNLDTWFPESFVSKFEDNVYFGNSTMLDETFEMALEIRTRYTIVNLWFHNTGEDEWNPDQILTELWFDQLEARSQQLPLFEDTAENGEIKTLMRSGPTNTEAQGALIMKRVLEIRSAFRQSEDAVQAGDLVDWDQLKEQFPWLRFLAELAQYATSRLDEITESIRQQGGVDNIVKTLVETIKNNNSQSELTYEPQPSTATARQLLPPANIEPGTSGHNLMNRSTIYLLESMKQKLSAPPSAQSQRKTAPTANAASSSSHRNAQLNRPGPSRIRAKGPSEPAEDPWQGSEDFRSKEDHDDRFVIEPTVRSSADYLSTWDAHARDKNKENRPLAGQAKGKTAKRFIDQQANAQKVRWNSQESDEDIARSSKRKLTQTKSDDENDSQDEGFQSDQRNPNLNLRTIAQTARRVSPSAVRQPSPKRARIQESDEVARAARRRQQQEEAALQANARREASDEEFEEEDELEERPRPSASQIVDLARRETAIARQRTAQVQSRTAWSEEDAEHLIDLIENMGCSWSAIYKAGRFQVERDQVALKDKARNLKVAYLKSGVPLPPNFDKVALGQKEIRSVRTRIPGYNGFP